MRTSGKSKEQLELESLLPKGFYEVEVFKAKDGLSKAGNEQTTIEVGTYDAANNVRKVTDYLGNASARSELKTRGFAEAFGLLAQYDAGDMPDTDMVGKRGYAFIDVQPPQNGYSSKNVVKFYLAELPAGIKATIAPAFATPATSGSNQPDLTDDDIPF